jgi:hypothetical protein
MKPSLKKPGDFTVAEGHGHPLVLSISSKALKTNESKTSLVEIIKEGAFIILKAT